jgi:hypothetical protein
MCTVCLSGISKCLQYGFKTITKVKPVEEVCVVGIVMFVDQCIPYNSFSFFNKCVMGIFKLA